MNDVPLKPAMTTAEHIILLQERGMHVDEELAQQWLRNVFYYRLSAYWYPCRKWGEASDGSKKRLNKFMPDTNFADAVALYEADRKLRTLIYDGIERVEVGFRTRICELLLAKNPDDPLLYRDESIFREKFDHQKWLKTADNRVKRAIYNRNRAVQHYSKKYEKRYPLWVLMDVLDFSDISRLYSGLKSSDQHKIATELGIEIDWNNLSPNMRKKRERNTPWLSGYTNFLSYVTLVLIMPGYGISHSSLLQLRHCGLWQSFRLCLMIRVSVFMVRLFSLNFY